MVEYISCCPEAEVSGRAIWGMIQAMGERAVETLAAEGIEDVTPEAWYPQQKWLNALKTFDQGGFFDLIAIGKQTSLQVALPPNIHSIEDILLMQPKTYQLNNRNCDGHMEAELVAPGHIRLMVCTPYPRNMIYGVIYGFAARFKPHAIVRYADDRVYNSDADCCEYHVTWLDE